MTKAFDISQLQGNLTPQTVNVTYNGNALNFTGVGQRITGDFNNVTVANRIMFQNSVVNDSTQVSAIPNGTGTYSAFVAINNSTPTNAGFGGILCSTSEVRFTSDRMSGSGTYLPSTFFTGGLERVRINTDGSVRFVSPSGFGYGTGAGGTVTQATSKATPVTLNTPSGLITMNNASLAANGVVTFQFNNSLISITDQVIVTIHDTASYGAYVVQGHDCRTGACQISLRNVSTGPLSEGVVLRFNLIKGSST